MKLHLVLDHDGYLPSYAVLTEGNTADITAAKRMTFAPGTMLVFDRGYADYNWWLTLTRQKVHFVTRLKDSMLLVKYLQLKSTFSWSLSNLVALLRQQLFVYRDLFQWLNDPFKAPPILEGIHDGQTELAFGR